MAGKKVVELNEKQRERFDKCWNVYPRKVNKGEAELSWGQIDPDDKLTEKIYESILSQNRDRGTKFLTKDEKKFIKHFSSWLRAKGWVYESENEGELVSLRKGEGHCACGQTGKIKHQDKLLCIKCYDKAVHPEFNKSVYENLCKRGLGKRTDETKEEYLIRMKTEATQALRKFK